MGLFSIEIAIQPLSYDESDVFPPGVNRVNAVHLKVGKFPESFFEGAGSPLVHSLVDNRDHISKRSRLRHSCHRQGRVSEAGRVRTVTYALHRVSAPQTHAYAKPFETGILHGQAVLRVLLSLRAQGYEPDVIVAHGGWGEALFTKDAFPNVPLLHFAEFYYRTTGADVGFDPEFPMPLNDRARVRAKNGVQLLNLEQCDAAVTPTRRQHSIHPAEFHSKIRIVLEGVDTDTMRPDRAIASYCKYRLRMSTAPTRLYYRGPCSKPWHVAV